MRAGSWEETGSWRDCRGQSHTRFVHIVLLSEMKYVTFNCCSVAKSPEKIISRSLWSLQGRFRRLFVLLKDV